ncbi:MAG TPA: thiamine diphosphokinase [Acidimicrobiales bacterium]|nr:thiamine diphosphokinase [Acidimicrobiales bacterium]
MRAIVVAGGDRDLDAIPSAWSDAMVIGADSGIDFAHTLELKVDVAIGDMDSVSAAGLERAETEGARIERHPAEKDQTDLELALHAARDAGATDLLVIGVGGGRLDHLLANVLLLAAPTWAPCRISALAGTARMHVVRGGEPVSRLDAEVGELLTLLAIGGEAHGITTTGLKYALRDEALAAGTSRGVSNVVESTPITLELEDGTLLAVFPGR